VKAFGADGTERSEEFDGDAETVLGMRLDAHDAGQVLESEAAARRGREADDDDVHALEVGSSPGAEVEAADGNVDGGADFFEVASEAVAGPGADGLRDGHAASAAAVVRPGRLGRGKSGGGGSFHGARPQCEMRNGIRTREFRISVQRVGVDRTSVLAQQYF